MIADDIANLVLTVFNGKKVDIVVPLYKTIGRSSGDDVYEIKVKVEVPNTRNWLIPWLNQLIMLNLLVQNHGNFKDGGMW